MDWNALQHAVAAARAPAGYRVTLLQRGDVADVIAGVRRWYPDICVGTASCLVQREFYEQHVAFGPDEPGHVFVVAMRCGRRIVGVMACEIDREAFTLYGRVVVVAPDHRGAGLGRQAIVLIENIGRELGMGLVYGLATLKIPHVQRAFEHLGWRLVGIAPGFDREFVAGGGAVERVYEAIFAKVLAPPADLQRPCRQNMTPQVRRLFDLLFTPTAEEACA